MVAIRIPFAVVAGALLSIALFLTLSQLVSVPFDVQRMSDAPIIQFTTQRVDTPVETRREERVQRDPPILQPGPTRISDDFGGDVGVIRLPPTRVDPIKRGDGLSLRGVDGDAMPMVRPEAVYPQGAAEAGIEGWVQVRFSVTAAGTVRDAVIVASEPGTTFDEAALKAIARWRYNPRVESGVAVERVGLQTILRFELEN